MAKKIGILGGKGNMGTRYKLICQMLGHETVVVDIGQNIADLQKCDGLIIATPTHFHLKHCEQFAHMPILCEKPMSFDLNELEKTLSIPGINIRMINQYAWYEGNRAEQEKMVKDISLCGPDPVTLFNYYRHGGDGLYWDCINIIGLSTGRLILRETSPIWTLWLNGWKCDIGAMDAAYVWNIKSWLSKLDQNHEYIISAHKKTQEYAKNAYKY